MSEQKHTPGPWIGESLAFYKEIDGHKIMLGQLGVSCDRIVKPEKSAANVRRIVLCVNACEGVDNEFLEKFVSGELKQSELFEQQRELQKLTAQRDELVSALKDVANLVSLPVEVSELVAKIEQENDKPT